MLDDYTYGYRHNNNSYIYINAFRRQFVRSFGRASTRTCIRKLYVGLLAG